MGIRRPPKCVALVVQDSSKYSQYNSSSYGNYYNSISSSGPTGSGGQGQGGSTGSTGPGSNQRQNYEDWKVGTHGFEYQSGVLSLVTLVG